LHGNGALLAAPSGGGSVSWTHDAADPVPSPVRDPFSFLAESPDESSLASRSDVLTFTGPVLDEPLDLVGPIRFEAAVGSDGPEMDVFARLADVAPDGSAHLIARGQQTILDPGRSFPVVLDLGHVGYRLPAGHTLRLTVASSDAPEFIPAPGTGEHRWLAATTKLNRQTLHLGACRLSTSLLEGNKHG
jgi:putative CocE/NonD family hydrolase